MNRRSTIRRVVAAYAEPRDRVEDDLTRRVARVFDAALADAADALMAANQKVVLAAATEWAPPPDAELYAATAATEATTLLVVPTLTDYLLSGQAVEPSLSLVNPIVGVILDDPLFGVASRLKVAHEDARRDVARKVRAGWEEGASLERVARSLRVGSETSMARARAIVRSEMTRAQSAGMLATIQAANQSARNAGEALVATRKRWVATRDNRTRASHKAANQQTVGLDEAFRVGGSAMNYPGDPMAPSAETVWCRCTIGFEP